MSLIPERYLDSVVSIGYLKSIWNSDTNENVFNIDWQATGFIVGYPVRKITENEKGYHLFLVTCKHVVKDRKHVHVRFNRNHELKAEDLTVISTPTKDGISAWIGHPKEHVDIAVFGLPLKRFTDHSLQYSFFTEHQIMKVKSLREYGILEGHSVFTLGFPLGMVHTDRKHVFVRGGIISRIRDLFEGKFNAFFVDTPTFPGNSGSAVITKSEITSIEGKPLNKSCLIGITTDFIQQQPVSDYSDGDNIGLTIVQPVDRIIETIEEYYKKRGKDELLIEF